MSILTCASGEEAASLSSCNMNNGTIGGIYPPQHLIIPQNQNPLQQLKKKRNQPGNPDPEAEVIALSPKTLVATNRFFCEICNKGFRRDQNLQLHRRGHNLPWKLKKRENTNEVVRKKVYVCPETSCVHHDPSRALGDLTGIKKHFSRKHGEKKWKCEKCSKRYAVQSDCKAHSKTCGTKEYKCECGTLFSRRDSFITHRAFCETLAVESARSAITGNPIIFPSQAGTNSTSQMNLQFQPPHYFNSYDHLPAAAFSMKKEQPSDFRHIEIPPWLMTSQPFVGAAGPGPPPPNNFSSSSIFQATKLDQEYMTQSHKDFNLHQNPNPNLGVAASYHSTGECAVSSHISATALLQKAAQLGAAISNKASAGPGPGILMRQVPAHQAHVSVTTTKQTGLNLSSREELTTGPAITSGMMMTSFSNNATGFEDAIFGGFSYLNSKKDDDYFNGTINEDMTKDFLGLRPLSHNDDIFNIVHTATSSEHDHFKNHKTWQS